MMAQLVAPEVPRKEILSHFMMGLLLGTWEKKRHWAS